MRPIVSLCQQDRQRDQGEHDDEKDEWKSDGKFAPPKTSKSISSERNPAPAK